MEPHHGRRGKESNVVCGMNRAKQTTLLMLAMVASMALVLLWEAPFNGSTPIPGPGSDLEEMELRIHGFESRPLPSTDEGTDEGDEKTKGHDQDTLQSNSSSEVGSSAGLTQTDNITTLDGQSFPEVEQQQDMSESKDIVEESTELTDSDDVDESSSEGDVGKFTGTEGTEAPPTGRGGALEAVAPFESLQRSSSEVPWVPESGEGVESLGEEDAGVLVDDTASGYDSRSNQNATGHIEDPAENSSAQNLTLGQSSESEDQIPSTMVRKKRSSQPLDVGDRAPSPKATDLAESFTNVSSVAEAAEFDAVTSPSNRAKENEDGFADETIDRENLVHESEKCDYTVGKWVLDKTRPLYSGRECSMWLSSDFACRRHNHPDKQMDRYRWQPARCDLPPFNASAALETLRDKVVAFVGDSLGRQQLQSLLCMLTRGKDSTRVTDVGSRFKFYKPRGARRPTGFAYHFGVTNTTVVFKWTVTLARVQALNPKANALHLDRPEQFLEDHLHELDVLIVNSGHHWNNGKMNQNHYQFYNNNKPVPSSSPLSHVPFAYNQTVHNVVKWLHKHHKPPQQVIYYRSLSPRHFRNGDWNTGGTCDMIRFEGEKQVQEGMRVDVNAESAVAGTGVRLLNVTSLSLERGETHVSKYGGGKGGQDCLHWCLPGVPDTWNEILLAELGGKFQPRSRS